MLKYINKYLILFLFSFLCLAGYYSVNAQAAEDVIETVKFFKPPRTTTNCEKISENIFLAEEEINGRTSQIQISLTDPEKYEVVQAYNSFTKATNIAQNTTTKVWNCNFNVSSSEFDSFGAQTYYVDIKNEESNETETYIFIAKRKNTITRDGAYFFTSKAELLDSSKNSDNETSIEYIESNTQVKKLDSYNSGNVYVRFTRPHKPYTIYSKNTAADWMKPDINYFRINGSEPLQFNSSSDDDDSITSAPIHLKQGWNVIESYSKSGLPYFGESAGLEQGDFTVLSPTLDEFVWLINYTGEEQEPVVSDNTHIKKIRAVNYVYKYQETFAEYSSQADPAKDEYVINLPGTMKYPYILLQVTPDDAGAIVTMPESMVKASYGPIYSIGVTPNETESVPVTVTASNGTSKVQDIKLNWLSSDCNIEDVVITNGHLDGEVNSEDTSYLVDVSGEDDVIYKVKVSKGATACFNGKDGTLEDGYYTYSSKASDSKVKLVVMAEDGITKKSYTFVNNTAATYFGVSAETKAKAKELLEKTNWYTTNSKFATGRTWDVFMRAAVGRSFDDTYVFDVTTATIDETCPAKTYGSIILDLVITGENPYDFNGTNYVELLEKCADSYGHKSFGPYGTDIWAYIGLKAAGAESDYPYMSDLTERVKNYAMDSTATLEMRCWAWAALGDELSRKQQIKLIEEVRETYLWTSGDDAGLFVAPEYQNSINSNCHGCVITGLNSMNYDVESFKLDDTHSPLLTLDTRFYDDGEWKFRNDGSGTNDEKDVIIALGEVVTGESIFNKYIPTNDDITQLLATAKSILGTGSKANNEALQSAYDAASKVSSKESGFGKEYFTLYSAVAAIDASKVSKPNARMCSESVSKKIDNVITLISNLKDAYTLDDLKDQSAYNDALEAYNDLAKDYYRSYVTNSDKLLKIGETLDDLSKVAAVIEQIENLPDEITVADKETVETVQKAYDELGELRKQIPGEKADKYTKAVSDLQVAVVADKINSLPAADKITLNDKDAIQAAQKAYDALNPEQQTRLRSQLADVETKLKTASAAITQLEENAKKDAKGTTQAQKPTTPAQTVKKGSKIVVGKYRYTVTNISDKKAAVTFTGAKNKNLAKISIPATVKYKGKTYKVTSVGASACKNYKKLKTLIIGKNVTTIGTKAFGGCKKLSKITIKTTQLKKVGAKALTGINKKAVIKVPAKRLAKYKKLLKNKGQKKTVKIKK